MQDFALKYFQKGAMAMSHTEAQMEFVIGRAAMVPCGLWLENEMRDATPEGFEMACFPIPMVEGGKGDPTMVVGSGGEMFFVFADGGHPREAMDFMKYMMSRENGADFSRKIGAISSIVGATQKEDVSPALVRAVEVMEEASGSFNTRIGNLYLEWNSEVVPPALTQLLSGKITPERFGEIFEEGIEAVRRNPDIYKPPPMQYLPPGGGYE